MQKVGLQTGWCGATHTGLRRAHPVRLLQSFSRRPILAALVSLYFEPGRRGGKLHPFPPIHDLSAAAKFPAWAWARDACKWSLPGYNGGMKFIDFNALSAFVRQVGTALVIAGIVQAFLVEAPMGEPATVVTIGVVSALVGCIQKPKGGDTS